MRTSALIREPKHLAFIRSLPCIVCAREPRKTFTDKHWNEPLKWDRKAAAEGVRQRVFCASMADVFDDHPSIASEWRDRLWSLIGETPNLDWLLLTKRPENIKRFLPTPMDPWPNIRLGTTVEHQDMAERRMPYLAFAGLMGWKTFVSYEPALGPVNWWPWLDPEGVSGGAVHWIVAGGESGNTPRPTDPDWFRQCRDDCRRAGVPFLFKQWGGRNKKAAGRTLDGEELLEFPA